MGQRLAVVTTSYPTPDDDSAGHFVAAEVAELAEAGHFVTVIAPGRGTSQHGLVRTRRVGGGDWAGSPGALYRLRQKPLRAARALMFVREARHELEHGDFERVIAHWLVPCGWPVAVVCRGTLEVVAHGSDVRLLLRLPRPAAARVVSGLLARDAQLRFVSEEQCRQLAEHTGLPLCRLGRVAPSPISLGAVPTREAARSRLCLHTEHYVVAVVGRLIAEKRIAPALEQALRLAPDVLVVIGDGPLRQELQRSFPAARFLGQLSRQATLEWLAAADLLVSASRQEGAPTAIREARALGVPCWCEPSGDLRHWALHDDGLRLFEHGPPHRSLSRGIKSTRLHGRVRLSS